MGMSNLPIANLTSLSVVQAIPVIPSTIELLVITGHDQQPLVYFFLALFFLALGQSAFIFCRLWGQRCCPFWTKPCQSFTGIQISD
jgi:hypothetical protein